jgi:hypothetical protein
LRRIALAPGIAEQKNQQPIQQAMILLGVDPSRLSQQQAGVFDIDLKDVTLYTTIGPERPILL